MYNVDPTTQKRLLEYLEKEDEADEAPWPFVMPEARSFRRRVGDWLVRGRHEPVLFSLVVLAGVAIVAALLVLSPRAGTQAASLPGLQPQVAGADVPAGLVATRGHPPNVGELRAALKEEAADQRAKERAQERRERRQERRERSKNDKGNGTGGDQTQSDGTVPIGGTGTTSGDGTSGSGSGDGGGGGGSGGGGGDPGPDPSPTSEPPPPPD